jgi:hypothetical protein
MGSLRFDPAVVVQQAREAFDGLPFTLEEWLDEKGQDFELLEQLDSPSREDAFYAVGRLQGAAEACDLTMLELTWEAGSSPRR